MITFRSSFGTPKLRSVSDVATAATSDADPSHHQHPQRDLQPNHPGARRASLYARGNRTVPICARGAGVRALAGSSGNIGIPDVDAAAAAVTAAAFLVRKVGGAARGGTRRAGHYA